MAPLSITEKIHKLKEAWDGLKSVNYYCKVHGHLKWDDIENCIETYLSICEEANDKEKELLVTIGSEIFKHLSTVQKLPPTSQIIYSAHQTESSNTADILKQTDYHNPKIVIEIPSLSNSNGPAFVRVRRMKEPHNKKLNFVIYGTLVLPDPEINYNRPPPSEERPTPDLGYIKLFKLINAILYIRLPSHITEILEFRKGSTINF